MDLDTIRKALGELQSDAESVAAWESLGSAVEPEVVEREPDVLSLLAAARHAHAERGEWEAVEQLLALEVRLSSSDDTRVGLLMELARVRSQELLDEAGAFEAYEQVQQIQPDDELAQAAIAESKQRQDNWKEMVEAYSAEAESAPDDVYKASMLMRVAEAQWRFAGSERDDDQVLSLLAQAAEADPKNTIVLHMLERIYRRQRDHRALARVLERWAQRGGEDGTRLAAAVRLARLYQHQLNEPEAAAKAYEQALTIDPGYAEAKEVLVSYYSSRDDWDRLVALYEREVTHGKAGAAARVGDMLQIAMLHYRKREAMSDAAAWFEKIREVDPANGAMLDFYRDFSRQNGDEGVLLSVLQGAQRVLPEGPDKQGITAEIARLAESQQDAQKAIEQYKTLWRQDPDNREAVEALKGLYRKTRGYNQLVDILRSELERLGDGEPAERARVLREVASIYRDHIPNDTSLVSVLNQQLQVEPDDKETIRELIRLYEKLGRWRDLLASQQRLAERSDDPQEKAALLRESGRRWLEQFSNVQNATQAFEELRKVLPEDREARDTLTQLYKRRRAWAALYALYEQELQSLHGAERIAIVKEMAALAANRLGKGDVAARLYKEVLEAEPNNAAVLDALEKQAERSKDWTTLADALERRLRSGIDAAAQVQTLQKLGSVYAEQLADGERAITAWRRILEIAPGHARAMRVLRDEYLASENYEALEQLYASQSDYEGLAEVFSNAADRATNLRAKIELSYRAAEVYETHLAQPERAFRCYERVLAADPLDARAARALVPLYEADEKWSRLPALYELLIQDEADPERQFELYRRLIEVMSVRLSDRAAALQYARRAYDLRPADSEALQLLEEASRDAHDWQPMVEALEARLQALGPVQTRDRRKKKKKGQSSVRPPGDHAERRALELKLAEVYDERLSRGADAVRVLKQRLSVDPTDGETAQRLEGLLRREGARDDLRWLLGLRIEHAPSDEQRHALLRDWARLEEEVFEDLGRASELYRRVVEFDPNNVEAMAELSRLLLAQGEVKEAVAVMQQQKQASTADEARLRLEEQIAHVNLFRLQEPEPALEAALAALELDPTSSGAVEVLQRLVDVEVTKERAASALTEVYQKTGERRHEAEALAVLLSTEKDPATRRALYERAVAVLEGLDSFNAAFELMVRACRDFPEELELWDRATELAARASRGSELAETYRDVLRGELDREVQKELCERAAALHEEQLGDPVGATPYLEQVLTLDPANHAAFLRLKQILTSNQRWGELQALYDQMLGAVEDEATRLEVLSEVAMVCEEFMDDSQTAIGYYEQIVELDAAHRGALVALDRLYAKHERFEPLAELLERRLSSGAEEEPATLRLRLAEIALDKLHQPELAMRQIEEVLSEDVNNARGRELAERILEIGSLRIRAALLLERVYEARDEVRELVRVLDTHLRALRDGETPERERELELLERIGSLRDDRLRDDRGAFEAFSQYLPLAPTDAIARERLLQIAQRIGAEEQAVEVLELSAAAANDVPIQGETLMQAARLREQPLGQSERAKGLYERVLKLAAGDATLVLPAAQALQRLNEASADHAGLVAALRTELELQLDAERRMELHRRIAELCEHPLGDLQGALGAWQARREEHPDDVLALQQLDRLYEETGDYAKLVEILDVRAQLEVDAERRRELLRRSAVLYATKLEQPRRAIEAYRTLNDQFGPTLETLEALGPLLQAEQRWDELIECLEAQVELAHGEDLRLAALARIGDLRREQLRDWEGALLAYREVIEARPSHEAARAALVELLQDEQSLTRRQAAELLAPVYRGEAEHAQLLGVLQVLIDATEDPLERLDVLQEAVDVAEHGLNDYGRAFELTERAVRDGVSHTDLSPWLERLDRLSAQTERRAEQVQLLREVVDDIFHGDVQFRVILKIATLARDELNDPELAVESFRRALDVQPESDAPLLALQQLYEQREQYARLLEVLERRAELAASESERLELLLKRAELLSSRLDDAQAAIGAYEALLDLKFEPRAVEALKSLYVQEQRFEALIELYHRQLETRTDSRAEVYTLIADVAAERLHDVERAFDALEAALEETAQFEGAVTRLERLMRECEDAQHRARAATLLEPIYLSRGHYDRVKETLEARLEGADAVERRELLQRLAQLNEEQLEDYAAALEVVAQLLHEDITDEPTVSELERLAKVSDNRQRLAEIYAKELEEVSVDEPATARLAQRTGELLRELAQAEAALGFFRRAFEFQPESSELFQAIDGLLAQLQRPKERVQLYRQALEHRYAPQERLRLLQTLADLYARELGDKAAAIDVYVEVLDLDDNDAKALDTLSRLYYDSERYEDLYDLVLRRAEAAPDQTRALAYRLALAQLCRKELKDDERALEQLEQIVEVEPSHAEALAELEQMRKVSALKARVVDVLRPLYEQAGDWRHLIRLNEDRFEIAELPAEKVMVLRETAELWEHRGRDAGRALQVLVEAVKLDPEDADTRREFERLVEQTGAWVKLPKVYEAVLESSSDLLCAKEMWLKVAQVQDGPLDDPRAALLAYERVRQLDETDLHPLERMEALATLLSDWETLDGVLVAKADLILDDEGRASLWRRVAEGRRDMLDRHPLAIEAYERALELEPEHAFTVDCLIELYEAQAHSERLVELYLRRVELAEPDDTELCYELLRSASRVYEETFHDRQRAIELLNEALLHKPDDATVLGQLNQLYRQEQQWPQLLDNLRVQTEIAESGEQRALLHREMGDICARELESFDEALDAFAAALSDVPDDAATRSKVFEIGQRHEELRERVAEVLLPALAQVGAHEERAKVLELRLTVEHGAETRAETLRELAELYQFQVQDEGLALDAVLRAVAEVPQDESLHENVERLCQEPKQWRRYVEALTERAQTTFEAELARDLLTRAGRIYEQRLDEPRPAIEAYGGAVAQVGDQPDLLEALDRLYLAEQEYPQLADVLERRTVLAETDEERAELFYRLACLQLDHFNESGQALGTLRSALDLNPLHEGAGARLEALTERRDCFEEAVEILEQVYRARGATQQLAALYQKRVAQAETPGERIEMRKDLARVLEDELHDPTGAQQVLQQGLEDDLADGDLLAEIERLAGASGEWRGAAEVLERALSKASDVDPTTGRELSVRLADWWAERVQDFDAAERALERALEFEANNDDVLVQLEDLQNRPGRERQRVETLRRRARLQLDEHDREQLYRQARELSAALDDGALAETLVRELLEQDSSNLWALSELSRLREEAEDHAETLSLLLRLADVVLDAAEVSRLRHRAALLARERLEDRRQATELYERLFEDDPFDRVAASALRQLYAEAERKEELAQLLERLIDIEDDPQQQIQLRLELAELRQRQFADSETAVELLRTVLADHPGHAEAVVRLSRLYEELGYDEELAALLSEQIAAARERGDDAAQGVLQIRLAEMYESKLSDTARAIQTYQEVLEREPRHLGALGAVARLYEQTGEHAQAAEVLSRLVEFAQPEDKVQYAKRLAAVYEQLDDVRSAAAALEAARRADPADPELRARLEQLYRDGEQWDSLARLLADNAESSSDTARQVALWSEAATLLMDKQKDYAGASLWLEAALEKEPDNRRLLMQLCDAYNASGRAREAVNVLERVVASYGGRRSKELAEVHRRLADAFKAEGQLERAISELDKAFRIEPGNVSVLKALGQLALEAGDHKRALQMFRALLLQRLGPDSPISKAEVFYHLGIVHHRLGERAKAVQQLERALQTDSSLTAAQELLNEISQQ